MPLVMRMSFIFIVSLFAVVYGMDNFRNYKSEGTGKLNILPRQTRDLPRGLESFELGEDRYIRPLAVPQIQPVFYNKHASPDKEYDYDQYEADSVAFEPEFTFNPDAAEDTDWGTKGADFKTPFALPPSNPQFYRSLEPKRASPAEMPGSLDFDFEDSFSEPRHQRQNPNLSANKFNKIMNSNDQIQDMNELSGQRSMLPFGKITSERDIPTSLVPASPRHHHILQQSVVRSPAIDRAMNIYIYAMIAGIMAAATVAIGAFAFGWYTMQRQMKAAADAEYPAYGVTGPNPHGSPSGDRRLAHSAQLYHYQHQKQQIIAMENRGGVAERNGSVSDVESEDENEEGDYTVYECPGFATTGELEVKNPLFLDEPTPATPASGQNTAAAPK